MRVALSFNVYFYASCSSYVYMIVCLHVMFLNLFRFMFYLLSATMPVHVRSCLRHCPEQSDYPVFFSFKGPTDPELIFLQRSPALTFLHTFCSLFSELIFDTDQHQKGLKMGPSKQPKNTHTHTSAKRTLSIRTRDEHMHKGSVSKGPNP